MTHQLVAEIGGKRFMGPRNLGDKADANIEHPTLTIEK
jgi:hypothetical protein